MDINSKSIKISRGKTDIENELEMGQEVKIAVVGSVVKIEDTNNQDNTINRCFIIKAEKIEII
jgi:hypothetical protein